MDLQVVDTAKKLADLACSHAELYHNNLDNEGMCWVAANTCSADFANFYQMYYCGLNQSMTGFIIIDLVLIFFIFRYTGMAVDEYIVEGIQKIADALRFSEGLAAVTLLALANGAGDVITALVAGGAEGGVSYNVGSLFGAGLFVFSFVVAICIIKNQKDGEALPFLKFEPEIIYRDVGFYLLSTVVTLIFAACGSITWFDSVILLLIYVAMVSTVVITECLEARKKKNEPVDENKVKLNDTFTAIGRTMYQAGRKQGMVMNYFKELLRKKTEIRKEKREAEEKDWKYWVETCIDTPFKVLLYLTALPADPSHYNKTRLWVFSFTGVYFFSYVVTKEFYGWNFLYGSLPVAVVLALLVIAFPNEPWKKDAPLDRKSCEEEHENWAMMICNCVAVLSGLAWTYILCGLLIDMLNTLGLALNLDNTYLGLTILAVGNALPDALTTISLAAKGQAVMALSSGYAGQLFGLLVGFGLSMLKLTLTSGSQVFDLFSKPGENMLDILVVMVALICLGMTFLWGVFNKFKMNRVFAYLLLLIYACFIIACTIIAVIKAVYTY